MGLRKKFRFGSGAAPVFSILALVGCCAVAQAQPHVVFLTIDDLSRESLGLYGCPVANITPNLDTLGTTGLRFEHAHVAAANCTPSRNVMVSGKYPHNNRVLSVSNEGSGNQDTFPTIPDVFRAAGYHTGIMGKNSHQQPFHPYSGWDAEYDGYGSTRDPENIYSKMTNAYATAGSEGKPLFFNLNLYDPHVKWYNWDHKLGQPATYSDPDPTTIYTKNDVPYPTWFPTLSSNEMTVGFASGYDVMDEVAAYYNTVKRADDSVGRMLDAIADAGATTNTIIIAVADHGAELPGAKTQLYHHSSVSPLFVVWPGVTSSGTVNSTHMVNSIDLLPTFCELAGQPVPADIDGRSFLPMVQGGTPSEWRDYIYKEHSVGHNMRAVQTTNLLYIFNPWSNGSRTPSTVTKAHACWDAIEAAGLSGTHAEAAAWVEKFEHRVVEELYDITTDPDCLINVATHPAYAAQLATLQGLMEQEMLASGDTEIYAAFTNRANAAALEQYISDDSAIRSAMKDTPVHTRDVFFDPHDDWVPIDYTIFEPFGEWGIWTPEGPGIVLNATEGENDAGDSCIEFDGSAADVSRLVTSSPVDTRVFEQLKLDVAVSDNAAFAGGASLTYQYNDGSGWTDFQTDTSAGKKNKIFELPGGGLPSTTMLFGIQADLNGSGGSIYLDHARLTAWQDWAMAPTNAPFDATDLRDVRLAFDFTTTNFSTNDTLLLEYYDGSAWASLRSYPFDYVLLAGNDYSDTVDLTPSTHTFSGNMEFRFRSELTGSGQAFSVSNLVIQTRQAAPGPPPPSSATAVTATYDFNATNFAGVISGGSSTASDMVFELAVPAPGTSPQVQQLAERSDGVGGVVYHINQRSFNDSDVVSMSATESGVRMTLTPASGAALDFSTGTVSVAVSVFSDGASVTDSIGLYAIVGGTTTAVDGVKAVTNPTGGSNTLDMYDVGTTTRVSGWNLTETATTVVDANLVFDPASVGLLAIDQPITFKVTGLVDKNNTSNFNSSFDDIIFTFDEVSPYVELNAVYDFNLTSFAASLSGAQATASDLAFELAVPAPGSNPQVQQLAERSDGIGNIVYYINQRSLNDSDVVPMAATESGMKFTLTPVSGSALDFSSAGTLSLTASVYSDGADVTDSLGLYAIIGSTTTAVDSVKTVTNPTGGSNTLDMYHAGTTTRVSGWNLTETATTSEDQTVSFDLSALGLLSPDQPVTFKVTLLANKNNTANFNSSFDDVAVGFGVRASANTPPGSTNDVYGVLEDTVLSVAAPGVLANDGDPDGDAIIAQLVSTTTGGVLALSTNGSFTYTPDTNFFGADRFTYAAFDGTSAGAPATVSITVTNVRDDPVAVSDAWVVEAGQTLVEAAPGVLANDSSPDGAPLSAVKVSDPSHGSLSLSTTGSFTYTPSNSFVGVDSFTYKVNDGIGHGNTVTSTVTVAEAVPGTLPNILIFFADDMGYGDTQVYNPSCPIDMPTVETLAQQGMVFTDAHTPAALCAPNRYSLLTGNFPWRGGNGWEIDSGSSVLPGQETIADMLQKAGYHTGMIGKGHVGGDMPVAMGTVYGPTNSTHPLAVAGVPLEYDWTQPLADGMTAHGFDYTFIAYGGIQDSPFLFLENDVLYGDPAEVVHVDGSINTGIGEPNGYYLTTNGLSRIEGSDAGDAMPYWNSCEVGPTLTTKAVDFIDAHHKTNLVNGTTTPFFLHYCAEAVHVPHTPPDNFLGTPVGGTTLVPSSKGGFSQHSDMLYELEVAFSNLVRSLEERGLLENTLIIFTSDNGGLKDSVSGTSFSNQPLAGYKSTAAEGGHRVPFIVKWGDGTPGGSRIPPGTTADQMVNIMDIYTTLAEILGVGVAPTQAFDSISMRDVWLNGSTNETRPFMAGFGGGDDYIRDGLWKYTLTGDYAGLYHLGSDLGETTDVSGVASNAARIAAMQAELNTILAMDGTTNRSTAVPDPEPDASVLADIDKDGMEDGWERLYFGGIDAVDGGSQEDYDFDSVVNLVEYALGGHPTSGIDEPSIKPWLRPAPSGGVDFIYHRRTNAPSFQLEYIPEHTGELAPGAWTDGASVEVGAENLGNGLESVTNRSSMTGADRLFLRLKVQHP